MSIHRVRARLLCVALSMPAAITAWSPHLLAQTTHLLAQTTHPAKDARDTKDASSFEGRIMAIDAGEFVLDLGSEKGARAEEIVEVWRPVRLRHPVTGATLTDRFSIGKLRLVQVRPALALARPLGETSRPPIPGDIILRPDAAEKPAAEPLPAASAPTPPSTASAPSRNPEHEEIDRILDHVRGKPPAERIVAYESYVRKKPNGQYAATLWEEAQLLRKLETKPATRAVAPEERVEVRSFDPPARVLAGTSLRFAVELEKARGAVLHLRNQGSPHYESLPMANTDHGYFAVTVPASQVNAPGLEYFVEAVAAQGNTVAVLGGADAPGNVPVDRLEAGLHSPSPTIMVHVSTDYASFNIKKQNDYVWQTEGVVATRFGDTGLRAVRSGFGVYRGRGGTLQELDELDLPPRAAGLTYGYLEGEFAPSSIFSVGARGVLGLRKAGVNGGALTFVRFGNDRKTNLLVGGELLGGIGLRGITELAWNSFEKIPIVLRTEVTNQPAGFTSDDPALVGVRQARGQGEVGVRLIGQVGYRLSDHLTISARGSYQGRTINHAGPGAGAAVTYQW